MRAARLPRRWVLLFSALVASSVIGIGNHAWRQHAIPGNTTGAVSQAASSSAVRLKAGST